MPPASAGTTPGLELLRLGERRRIPRRTEPLSFVASGSAVTTTIDTPCHRGLALKVTPGAIAAGRATSLHLYLANRSSIGVSLSSATVVVPRSLHASRASLTAGEKGSVRLRRGVLLIKGLRLTAGGTLRLRVTATAPVDCGTYSTSGDRPRWPAAVWFRSRPARMDTRRSSAPAARCASAPNRTMRRSASTSRAPTSTHLARR